MVEGWWWRLGGICILDCQGTAEGGGAGRSRGNKGVQGRAVRAGAWGVRFQSQERMVCARKSGDYWGLIAW